MSESSLPEEIVHRLLAFHFFVGQWLPSREDTELIGDIRFRLDSQERGIKNRDPTPLLVSRRWYRIGTPLLYEAAVLHTPAAISRLADTLKTRRELRPALRSVWLTSGWRWKNEFSPAVYALARRAPAVRVLALTTRVWSPHAQVCGLRDALPVFNPETLIIGCEPSGEEDKTRLIQEWIASAALHRWSRLKRVFIQHCNPVLPPAILFRRMLSLLPFHEVWIQCEGHYEWLGLSSWVPDPGLSEYFQRGLVDVAQNPHLRILCVQMYCQATKIQAEDIRLFPTNDENRRKVARYREVSKVFA